MYFLLARSKGSLHFGQALQLDFDCFLDLNPNKTKVHNINK